MTDTFDLDRFVVAQDRVYEQVLAELSAGRKTSHWIWFIFPQIEGLGHSPMARKYAIGSLDEARAYLEHPVLGPRLSQCAALVNAVEGRTISEILGPPDDMKFCSSMTLFARAGDRPGDDVDVFVEALNKYFDGEPDPLTLERL